MTESEKLRAGDRVFDTARSKEGLISVNVNDPADPQYAPNTGATIMIDYIDGSSGSQHPGNLELRGRRIHGFRPNHPDLEAVLQKARATDADVDGLEARAARIIEETLSIVDEAIRVRDQHRVELSKVVQPEPLVRTQIVTVSVPPTLVHWIRRQIALHPTASDSHTILTSPDVTIGALRQWLQAFDATSG